MNNNFDIHNWRANFLRESTLDPKEIEENKLKNLVGAAALTAASLLGSPKAQAQEVPQKPETTISAPQTTAEKRAEIKKRNQERIQKHFEDQAKKFGFNSVEDYKAWQVERNKGEDQPAGDLNISGANKRGETKGSCSTGEKNRGESLKDTK